MGYPQGINFRSTLGFVTDVDPSEFEGSSSADYPRTTARGNTVGWESGVSLIPEDIHSANDARLAGDADMTGDSNFRFDLPSTGSYNVRSACGGQGGTGTTLDLYDTSSLLAHLSSTNNSTANHFRDAIDADLTNVTWPGSNTAVNATFTTTICRFKAFGDLCFLCHAYVEAATAEAPPWFPMQQNADNLTRQINMIKTSQ